MSTMITLNKLDLTKFFDWVITGDDVKNPKPDPEAILLALDRLSLGPDRAIFVGDSTADIAAAKAAKVVVGAAMWGIGDRASLLEATPDLLFENVEELAEWIARVL